MDSRRRFLFKLAASASAPVALGSRVFGQAPPPPPPVKLEESDPVATALGYKTDTNKVDKTKYPQHKDEQVCSGCALFTPKAGEEFAPCSAFGGKLVANKGWCAAYAKKP
jgi:High potential iron-sulfur protein